MTTATTLVPARTLADLADQALTGPGPDEPGAARQEAAEWIARHGFPDRRHEDWRYVDLKQLLALPFILPNPLSRLTRDDIGSIAGRGLGGPQLVVVNGRLDPGLSDQVHLADGVHVNSPAPRSEQREGFEYLHAFEALNAVLAPEVCVLTIAEGAVIDVPIEIVYLTDGAGDSPVASPRALIVAGRRSSATVIETYLGAGTGPSMTNAYTRVIVGAGARLHHFRLQDEPAETFHLSTLQVEPHRDAVFASHLLAAGAKLGRHEVTVRLAEEGAQVDLAGLFLTSGDQCHDNPILIEHVAPGCASRLLYKGIVDGAGHGIFNGRVIVQPGAMGTDAHQTNKNLLLSDRAEVDTRPRLEIFADEVTCTHGAAVGQLDPDALFYLRSRGIPEPAARNVLVSGFANEILERYPEGRIRGRAEHLVASRLPEAEGAL